LTYRVHIPLIVAGTLILVASLAVWALTGRLSVMVAMSGFFLTMIGALQGAQTPSLRVTPSGSGA
jgi:hypothetical protein